MGRCAAQILLHLRSKSYHESVLFYAWKLAFVRTKLCLSKICFKSICPFHLFGIKPVINTLCKQENYMQKFALILKKT